MKKYSEEEILTSYRGRCISDREDLGGGYLGSAPIEIHRSQLGDPESWVHSSMSRWMVNPKPTIEQLQAENDKVKARNLDLDDALSLAHTELTEIPDWPDTEHQHFVSETVEQALKGGE